MEEDNQTHKELIHDLDSKGKKSIFSSKKMAENGQKKSIKKQLIVTLVIMIILGVGTGYIAANAAGVAKKGPVSVGSTVNPGDIKTGTMVGVNDLKQFPDTAEGTVQQGGIDGEGAYHLVRPGGDSQNVYMTSSIVDLSQFVGKKVKVWGQTQKAQKAGWLMDVGRLQVE